MTVEQTDVVDIISIEPETGCVVLTVSDHLDWSDTFAHQSVLQNKLNSYLAFVEGGEILKEYPNAKDRTIEFGIVFQFPPDEPGKEFLSRARAVIESAGFRLRAQVFGESRLNKE